MLRYDRSLLLKFAVLAALICLPAGAKAQIWPPKQVRIIVPFGAGSSPDIVGRLLAESFQARYPQSSFVVENKPRASGNIGTDTIAKYTQSGSTIGISLGGPIGINKL